MAGDSSTQRSGNSRPVLGDISNQTGKRIFSSILGSSGLKPQNGYGKNSSGEDGDSQLHKRTCLGVEGMTGEKIRTKFIETGKGKHVSLLKGKQGSCRLPLSSGIHILQENSIPVLANVPNQNTGAPDPLDCGIHPVRGDSIIHNLPEAADASRVSCLSSSSLPADYGSNVGKCQDDQTKCTSDGAQSNTVCEPIITQVYKNDSKSLDVDSLASNKDGSVEFSRLSEQRGSKSFELERCTGLKNNNCSNLSAGTDLIKNCTCSFCTKAAYMWADLHYQDIKGRIAALRKSQKEAAILVQRNCRNKETNSQGHANVNKSSNLELDLMGQWKSLFLHMEDILVRESSQLQANFLALQDLRDNCKMQLELIDGVPPDRQKRDSDGSRD